MPSHIERYIIEKFEDNSFRLYCEHSNREFCGILDEKELLSDLIRELELSKKERFLVPRCTEINRMAFIMKSKKSKNKNKVIVEMSETECLWLKSAILNDIRHIREYSSKGLQEALIYMRDRLYNELNKAFYKAMINRK